MDAAAAAAAAVRWVACPRAHVCPRARARAHPVLAKLRHDDRVEKIHACVVCTDLPVLKQDTSWKQDFDMTLMYGDLNTVLQ